MPYILDPPPGHGGGCPEQYTVLDPLGSEVGFIYLRGGTLVVSYCRSGEIERTLWVTYPKGSGMFTDDERDYYLDHAVRVIEAYDTDGTIIRPDYTVQEPIDPVAYSTDEYESRVVTAAIMLWEGPACDDSLIRPTHGVSPACHIITGLLVGAQRELLRIYHGEIEADTEQISKIRRSVRVLDEMREIAEDRTEFYRAQQKESDDDE